MTLPPADDWSLAIDFGTSNTAAAYLSRGQVRSIRLESGSTLMPSAVMVSDDGYRVGRAAVNQQRLHPESFEAAPKKRLGESTILLGSGEVEPVKLVAEIFRSVRQKALAVAGGTEPTTVWLTYPDAWPSNRVQLLRHAAELAGFAPSSIRLVSEPIAAVQYYASETSLPEGARLAVFDFGGGTCDVAVLVRTPDPATGASFTVIGSEGDNVLGGTDFDERIYDWVIEQLEARGETQIAEQLVARSALRSRLSLRSSVREAKEELSSHASSVIPVVVGDSETLVAITRTEYESIISNEIERALALGRRVLERTGTTPGSLDRLYLTGGSSLTPAIIRGLTELSGVTPATLDDPKLVVAQGALRTPLAPVAAALESPVEQVAVSEPAAADSLAPTLAPYVLPPIPAAPAAAPAGTTPASNRRVVVLAIIAGGLTLAVAAGLVAWGLLASQASTQDSTRSREAETAVETITCWDDSEVEEDDSCPALTGQAAADWAFLEPNSAEGLLSCTRFTQGTTEYEPQGWSELFSCSSSSAPSISVFITRWSSVSAMDTAWDDYWDQYDADLTTFAYPGSDGLPSGTNYSETNLVYVSDLFKYYDIPFAMEIYSQYGQDGLSDEELIDHHYDLWGMLLTAQRKSDIANVLETID